MAARRHQPGDVRHIDHQVRAYFIADIAENGKVNRARIGGCARHDHARTHGKRLLADGVIVDQAVFVGSIAVKAVQLAAEIDRRAMRQVAAVIQIHAQNGIAGLQQGHIGGHVGLAARMRLHVGMLRAK